MPVSPIVLSVNYAVPYGKRVVVAEIPVEFVGGPLRRLKLSSEVNVVVDLPDAVASSLRLGVSIQAGADSTSTAGLKETRNALNQLRAACCNAGFIRVASAGDGPTPLSGKVRFFSVDAENSKREHTLTVPASVVEECDGKLWLPSYFAIRTLRERLGFRPRRVLGVNDEARAVPAVLNCLDAIELGLEAAVFEAVGAVDKWRAEQAERARKQSEERTAEKRRMEERDRIAAEKHERERPARERAAAAAAKRAAVYAEKAAAKVAAMPRVHNARVTWVVTHGKFGKPGWRRELVTADRCTVRIAGKRVYIRLDGDEDEFICTHDTCAWTAEGVEPHEGSTVKELRRRMASDAASGM